MSGETELPTTAVYAISADPLTYGHINIIERVARTFPRVVVGIGHNPIKRYLFDTEERVALARQALRRIPNVEVRGFRGMAVDFACEQGADVLVKGVRNAADFDYEQLHHLVGLSQQVSIDTHILFADPALGHVSSSAVKAIQSERGFIDGYVPLVVKEALEVRLSNQVIIGVTGEIAAGKSTLCRRLVEIGRTRGIPVHDIDLDALAHRILMKRDEPLYRTTHEALTQAFGEGIQGDKGIDRARLAARVFGNPDALDALNRIMKPPMIVGLRKAFYDKRGIILLNGALLAETRLLELCNNRLVLVDVDPATQHKRLKARGLSAAEIASRFQAQWTGAEKAAAVTAAITERDFGWLATFEGNSDNLDSVNGLFDEIEAETRLRQRLGNLTDVAA